MAAPIWKTPKGNLGTIQEQEPYELTLNVRVPDDSTPQLSFSVIAGTLPPGIVLRPDGKISGIPQDVYRLKGVPYNVAQDTTSTFCIRATNLRTNQVSDRTFSLTVTGNDSPVIVTPAGELGLIYDGVYVEIPITVVDLDTSDKLKYTIIKGSLPTGLVLDSATGIIKGYAEPISLLTVGTTIGWSSTIGWDEYPWDFISRATSKRFEFDVSVTDSKVTVNKQFSLFVVGKDSLTADNDIFLINGYYDFITADQDPKRLPVLLTPSGNIGLYANDNYFAYKFEARDFDNDAVQYSILVGENIGFDNETSGFDSTLLDFSDFILPPGLTLNQDTGWLYGYIPSLVTVQKDYNFGVRVYKKNYPEYTARITNYTITIVSDLRYAITWISDSNLGTIAAGEISELAIEATNVFKSPLIYSLKINRNSRLPQGLKLLPNGLIVGRPSFEVTSFDQTATSFDSNVKEFGVPLPETTFDREYTFTVQVNDSNGTLAAEKTFNLAISPTYKLPYEGLYLRSNPGAADKEIFNQIVYNSDIIPNEFIYRNGDPYFGKKSSLDVLIVSGIQASTASKYVEAMVINHYRKKLLIGTPQTARALDENGNVKYEVLYLPMRDDDGVTSKSIDLRNKIKRTVQIDSPTPTVDNTYLTLDGYDKIIYPNALTNMRKQIIDTLGFADREVLPNWMTSKQEDGKIPYWNPALVLAYLKPGTSEQVKFLINRKLEYDLKDISFEVDRYVWDCNMSSSYDAALETYLDSAETTFDLDIQSTADTFYYTFFGDGSTAGFELNVDLDQGLIKVYVERYANLIDDSGLTLVRDNLIENIHYVRSGTTIIFNEAPSNNSTIFVEFTSNLVLEADYALDIPFNSVDAMTTSYIDNAGGLDFSIDLYHGKKVIFATQEQYYGYIGTDDGWIRNKTVWDDFPGWDDPEVGFDEYEIIPGYNENDLNPLIANQRAGIWEISVDENSILRLNFVQSVALNQKVYVKSGNFYGSRILKYGPAIRSDIGKTVPYYTIVATRERGNQTVFDGDNTRFIENINIYQDPDQGDKYLVFPRQNIFA